MKRNEWNEGLNHLEPDVVESYVTKKDTLSQSKKKHAVWIRFGAIAACFAIIVGTVFAIPLLRTGEDTNGAPAIFEPIISSETITGSNGKFIVGSHVNVHTSGTDDVCLEVALPTFEFYNWSTNSDSFIVKARVVKNHPSIYQEFGLYSTYKPSSYRLIQMETLQTIRGENMPQYFLYLIPEYLYVDMSLYDSLLICMDQYKTENYAIKNISENQIEAFPLPMFKDEFSRPDLGRIIAIRDGVFDESLWQNEAWKDGYSYFVDNPDSEDHIVHREDTEKDIIQKIKSKIQLDSVKPSVISLQFTSEELKAAVEYVKPFQNGVFVQTRCSSGEIVFTRYIYGFEADETVHINLRTGQVTYSYVRYTPEEIANLTEMGDYLVQKAKEYEAKTPTPPHTDTNLKVLEGLNLCAWYAKVDGKVYGVIKTTWRYRPKNNYLVEYYDDSYILYDTVEGTMTEMERKDLVKIVGGRNVSYAPYEGDTDNPCD